MLQTTAGKITITTIISGVFIFACVFLFDIGRQAWQTAEAQTATTTLTVRNIPPVWTAGLEARELTETATNTPLNTGEVMEWTARATNNLDYYLLICDTDTFPNENPGAPPSCDGGNQWAISGPTASGEDAIASTTTSESAPFGESNDWYGWICDADPIDPRCNATFYQGPTVGATPENSSPFVLNFRPVLTSANNNGPTEPGDTITWSSVSTDPDILRGGDELVLHVCTTNSFSNGSCDADTLATTSGIVTSDATASYEIPIPSIAFTYEAYVFLVDEFDHLALNTIQSDFDVANATPTVLPSSVILNNGDPIILTEAADLTSGFTLEFEVSDANTCIAVDGTGTSLGAGSQFTDTVVSVFREAVGSSTCDGTAGPYDPNNCYTSAVAGEWNLSCTASTTTCTDSGQSTTDMTMLYECEFDLWYVADPTDSSLATDVQFPDQDWFAAVSVVDVENATSSFTQGSSGVVVQRFLSFNLATAEIPYGLLELGENTGSLIATTTIVATGNTGVNQNVQGTDMCTDFSIGDPCPVSATSTIPVAQQQFGLSSATAYGSGTSLALTDQLVTLQVPKSTATTTQEEGDIYWGIEVPSSITLAGSYTGQNSFVAVASQATSW